ELSITVVPAAANFGAHSSDVEPPAENSAISGFAATASARLITEYSFPLKEIFLPTDFSDATIKSSDIGKFLSSYTWSITPPTIPVAPTTAIFILIPALHARSH